MMHAKKTNKAFTIIEIVLAVAILAMLMVALGAAFTAATQSYEYNEGMYKIVNTARQSLFRITTDLRTAKYVEPLGVAPDIDNRRCSLKRSDGRLIAYHYNVDTATSYNPALENNTLYLTIFDGPQVGDYVLCRNVTDMTFERAVFYSNMYKRNLAKNVQIAMTVTNDDATLSQTLNTAAVVRTNDDE